MPALTKRPMAQLKAWRVPPALRVSTYLTSDSSRIKAQKEADGPAQGPTGAEVDAYVAGTLSRKDLQKATAAPQSQSDQGSRFREIESRDEQGRVLGLEDPNDPALIDDPLTFPLLDGPPEEDSSSLTAEGDHTNSGRVDIVHATSDEVAQELVDKVKDATYGQQTNVAFFPAPTTAISTSLVSPNELGFVDPRVYGGTSFDLVGNGMHEPLNVVISANSSPEILTRKGFQSYCRSLDFDRECLGLHAGSAQRAWTDPRGWRDQEFLYREVYTPLDHVFGTCIESLVGGNHIRAWQQQGSGAWFLATSKEKDASKNHMIVPDGYNIGRDILVRQALGEKKDGRTSFFFTKYQTQVTYVAGLMPPGLQGVNHGILIDGLSAILTVKIVSKSDAKAAALSATDQVPQTAATEPSPQETAPENTAEETQPHTDNAETVAEESPAKKRQIRARAGRSRQSLDLRTKTKELWVKLKGTTAPKHEPVAVKDEGHIEAAVEPTSSELPSVDPDAAAIGTPTDSSDAKPTQVAASPLQVQPAPAIPA